MTLSSPNLSNKPFVTCTLLTSHDTQRMHKPTLYAPLYRATSSPMMKTVSSRSISSSMAAFRASRTVCGDSAAERSEIVA